MTQPLKDAFGNAFAGIAQSFQGRNFKIQFAFAVIAVFLGVILRISLTEWLVIVLCIVLVLSAEAANTALEAVVDLVSPEQHPLAGKAKDCAAGSVLILSLGSLVVAAVIFLPKLIALMSTIA